MFWIDDPSLSIGLMVVPQTDDHSTQTGSGSTPYQSHNPSRTVLAPNPSTRGSITFNANTSTTALQTTGFALSPDHSPTSAGLANVALANNVMNSAMSTTSGISGTTAVGGGFGVGYGVSRMSSPTKRGQTMSSLNEKQSLHENDQATQTWDRLNEQEELTRTDGATTITTEEYVQSTPINPTSDTPINAKESGHLSLKME
ncbi:hypothetical protein BGX27_000717 [Mortierella sp. AM989]|nr:hypothetical protein BGX27_000717 [Mortierella sp. AM989]